MSNNSFVIGIRICSCLKIHRCTQNMTNSFSFHGSNMQISAYNTAIRKPPIAWVTRNNMFRYNLQCDCEIEPIQLTLSTTMGPTDESYSNMRSKHLTVCIIFYASIGICDSVVLLSCRVTPNSQRVRKIIQIIKHGLTGCDDDMNRRVTFHECAKKERTMFNSISCSVFLVYLYDKWIVCYQNTSYNAKSMQNVFYSSYCWIQKANTRNTIRKEEETFAKFQSNNDNIIKLLHYKFFVRSHTHPIRQLPSVPWFEENLVQTYIEWCVYYTIIEVCRCCLGAHAFHTNTTRL